MNVRQLIEHLLKSDLEAEVMIDAPLCCSRSPVVATDSLSLPVRCVKLGVFPDSGKSWLIVQGTDAWGLNNGVE